MTDSGHVLQALRLQAWERAKSELMSILMASFSYAEGPNAAHCKVLEERKDRLQHLIGSFIKEVEDNALVE